jgi:pilus assembly protein Flp/PilA
LHPRGHPSSSGQFPRCSSDSHPWPHSRDSESISSSEPESADRSTKDIQRLASNLDNQKLITILVRIYFRLASINYQQVYAQYRTSFLREGQQSMVMLINLLGRERTATAIQYGMIATGISAAVITVVGTIGTNPNLMLTTVANALK